MPTPTPARAVPATVLLLVVLVAVNGVAVWGIFSARQSAEREALADLGLTTAARARALEAALASLAGDLIFLSQSPALVEAPTGMASEDPMVARWARVGAEGGLLLFLESHDGVERAVAAGDDGAVRVAVGRREGAPVVLPPESDPAPTPALDTAGDLHAARWPLGPREAPVGWLQVWIDPRRLLAAAVPGAGEPAGERLTVEPLPSPVAADGSSPFAAEPAGGGDADGGGYTVRRDGDDFTVSALVLDDRWDPPLAWELVRRAEADGLVRSFDRLAGRYRTTVAVNLGVVTLAAVLAFLAFREVRRSARLAAENAQQARVRELERQVMHGERLASVGRLAAGMAHEINNPLEGMSNYLSLLDDDLGRGDTDSARSHAGRVREGLERAAGITRQVLDYSDPGRAPKRPLDLRRAVADAVGFVRQSGAYGGVDVHLSGVDPEEPGGALPVEANPTALGQLFLNLLLNACEAAAGDGAAGDGAAVDGAAVDGTAAAAVEVAAGRRDGFARVTVADRGAGIPEDALPHLFEPFFSTRGSTGLGLAVCHGVVRDHGGRLTAANRPGGGALFTVELPLVPGAAPGATAEERVEVVP